MDAAFDGAQHWRGSVPRCWEPLDAGTTLRARLGAIVARTGVLAAHPLVALAEAAFSEPMLFAIVA